jgi:hypothetical protein
LEERNGYGEERKHRGVTKRGRGRETLMNDYESSHRVKTGKSSTKIWPRQKRRKSSQKANTEKSSSKGRDGYNMRFEKHKTNTSTPKKHRKPQHTTTHSTHNPPGHPHSTTLEKSNTKENKHIHHNDRYRSPAA